MVGSRKWDLSSRGELWVCKWCCWKFLIGSFKLTNMAWKERKSVPILIPVVVIEGIKLLISNTSFDIDESYQFMFGTKSSTAHCSWFRTVTAVCVAARVSVNATKTGTQLSLCILALTWQSLIEGCFCHYGHNKNINKENFQCPSG